MECPNCEFNNMPGLRACARCQSRLELAGVDFIPPRARERVMPMQVRSGALRAGLTIDRALGNLRGAIVRLFNPETDLSALLRCVVPGWGHRHIGYRRFGWFATAVWAVLVIGAVLFMGGTAGWTAYFMLVGWHAFTVSLILTTALRRASLLHRLGVGIAVYGVLNLGLYLPAGWLFQQCVVPLEVEGILSGPALRNGDVLLHTGPWLRPQAFERGDTVAYIVRRTTPMAGGYSREGLGVDRVIGVPGDLLEFGDGAVRVNGVTLGQGEGPLSPMWIQRMSMFVPPGEVIIMPSTLRLVYAGGQAQRQREALIAAVMHVKQEDVLGRVLIRTRPFSRLGPVREERLPESGETP